MNGWISGDNQRQVPSLRSDLLSAIALFASLGAGYVSIRARSEVSEARINALVDARLAARELKFVQAHAPKFREMFGAMDESTYGKDWNPRTLEELVAPMVKVVSGMSGNSE